MSNEPVKSAATIFREFKRAGTSPALRSFALQAGQKYRAAGGSDRRTQPRHYRCLDAIVVPLDQEHRPTAEAIEGVTRDLSCGGIAICLPRMVSAGLIAIQLQNDHGDEIVSAVQILRCRPARLFFEAAGPFTSSISEAQLHAILGVEATNGAER